MVQTARPIEDVLISGGWISNGAVADPLFVSINKDIDSEFILSSHEPVSELYVAKLNQFVYTEDQSGTWDVIIRVQKTITTLVTLNMKVQLRQLYEDEVTPGELIREELFLDIPDTLTDLVMNIPDFSFALTDDVSVRIEAITIP